MPTLNGEFNKYTEEEIYRRLETNLEDLLNTSGNTGSLVNQQLRAEARTLAENQEEALQRVYEAAYLEDAEDEELDKLVDLIGISRNEATSATGTVRFSRATPPTTTYTIPRGTEVQTSGIDPVVFETTELNELSYIDGFEDGNLKAWEKDINSVSIVNDNTLTGNQALELPATSDVAIRTAQDFTIGTIFEADIYPEGDTETGVRFGVQDDSNFFEAIIRVGSNDLELREVTNGSEDRKSSENVTFNQNESFHLTVEWSLYSDHRVSIYTDSTKETEVASVFLEDQNGVNWESGSLDLVSKDSVSTTLVDEVSVSTVTVNIEAQGSGVNTNIGVGAIRVLTDGLNGVEEVFNEVPTGNLDYVDTDISQFTIGRDREEDADLRERALNNTAIGGAATSTAIGARVNEVEGVQSVRVFTNKTKNTVDGLPPNSFEVVVHGGTDEAIANALHASSAADSTDWGGAHGTEKTYTVNSDVLAEPETYHWSKPTERTLDVTLDLIVDDTYIGNEEIKTLMVEYIGGTDTDGSFVPGTEPGEDVYEAVLKQRLIGPSKTGVWEVDTLTIDKNDDGTDDTTTLTSGADVLEIADSEIAQLNTRDSSISINTTTK